MANKYEFDEDFQKKVAALALRDPTFNLRTDGLVDPSYFSNESEATLVALTQKYWAKYKTTPSPTALAHLVKRAVANNIIRSDMVDDVKSTFKELLQADVSDREFVVDEVAEFARHQAIIAAMEKSVDALEKRDFDLIEEAMKRAMQVGVNEANEGHDYWGDVEARSEYRKDVLAGKTVPTISTGFKDLDERLDGGGFARKELSVLLGPAKRGKSFGLMNFAVNASRKGYNVLYVTLENSVEVTTRRMDAYVSQIKTNEILRNITNVETAIRGVSGHGELIMHEFAMNSFAPRDLRRLVENYRSKGMIFDEIVVDYWDIMAPDVRYTDNVRQESATIGMGLRAIAKDENCAMVTAIQSNREGFKAHTAGAEHVAEDFNKVRLADTLFSINADDDEKAAGEARLYMAAVRNMEGGYTINIKQDLSKATFIAGVLGRAGI